MVTHHNAINIQPHTLCVLLFLHHIQQRQVQVQPHQQQHRRGHESVALTENHGDGIISAEWDLMI